MNLIQALWKKRAAKRSAPSIEALVKDRALFDSFVYTPVEKAVKELSLRRDLTALEQKMNEYLLSDIPEPLRKSPKAVLFRQIATSNYEIRRFFSLIDLLENLDPLFWEYYHDKFTSNNEWKHALGKLHFYEGTGKKGGMKINNLNVIDFNQYNGKVISDVKTLWGQSLIDFHHELFDERFRKINGNFFDASHWFSNHGEQAKNYYDQFLALFVRNGILFENFLLDSKEIGFTTEIFLPAFINVINNTGYKPLIVSLEPTDIEDSQFWMCHPHIDRAFVEEKLAPKGV